MKINPFQQYVAAILAPPSQTFRAPQFKNPGSKLNKVLFFVDLQDVHAALSISRYYQIISTMLSSVTMLLFRYFFPTWECSASLR